jgi:hypothetical protein
LIDSDIVLEALASPSTDENALKIVPQEYQTSKA